ncbi:MAG: hypothetical protein ACLSB9_16165 [Hydrogeniiclostridium mannosilyticum]
MRRKKRGSHFDLPEDEADIQVNPDQAGEAAGVSPPGNSRRKKKKRIPGWVYRVIVIGGCSAGRGGLV